MKFTQLRLAGFKSFVDPAELRIDPGLTGVIGPNGCGKSNLLEALRWVMGATSAKSLRGGGMEDVIFAGTDRRPSRDRADVTLTVDNSDRRAPARFNDADTLEVVRRIVRGKGSDYRINGEEVRAKDVQLLFADAGTGANSPALVRQGQINDLISAKPENRRLVLEEAAGVAGLRARRREAQLRLNAAEANLDRLQEVVDDLTSRHQTLQRQARQAGRYRELSALIRELEALVWLRRWREAGEAVAAAQGRLDEIEEIAGQAIRLAAGATSNAEKAAAAVAPLRQAEAEASAALRLIEREKDAAERDLDQVEAEIARLGERITEIEGAAGREGQLAEEAREALARVRTALGQVKDDSRGDEAAIAGANKAVTEAEAKRAEAERALDEAQGEAAEIRARREGARRELAQAAARADRLEREAKAARERVEAFEPPSGPSVAELEAGVEAAASELETARTALAAADTALAAAREAAQSARDAAREAEGETTAFEREAQSLKRMLEAGAGEDDQALDAMRVDAGYETALAAALGDDLEASISDTGARRWTGGGAKAGPLPQGATPLNAVVDGPDALAARLAAVGVVEPDDLDRLAAALKPGQRLVTREGALRRWDGFAVQAGAPSAAALRLETRNRLQAVQADLAVARATAEAAVSRAETARETASEAERAASSRRHEAAQAETALRAAEKSLGAAREQAARDEARRANLEDTAKRFESELSAALSERAKAEDAAEQAEAEDDGTAALETARTAAERARGAASEARAALDSARRDAQGRRHRIASLEREEADWSRRAQSAETRTGELARQKTEAEAALEAAKAKPETLTRTISALTDRLGDAESAARLARGHVGEAEAAQREADSALRAAEKEAGEAREARAGAAATLNGAKERLADTAERLEDATGETPQALGTRAEGSEFAALSSSEVERRLDEARLSRERLGAVNLRADEESEELRAQADELTRERDELLEAVSRLRKAVDTLSKEGRTRLLEAFEVVNGHFQTLFATLFGGGHAELRLTENEDPLEAGLEIMACPPGKKLETMSLMSGGEQALTAAALIFAVFLSNPAPVCVLDEVDAPLDDANVDRFCTMLEEMRRMTHTRFLVITHNPVTMSRMDRLYGVTMGERGVSQLVSVNLRAAEELLAAE